MLNNFIYAIIYILFLLGLLSIPILILFHFKILLAILCSIILIIILVKLFKFIISLLLPFIYHDKM